MPETIYSEKPKIPDGGWGWVVVASSLILSMIADGVSLSFGLLYMEFLNQFNESNSKTSLIGSMFLSVPLLSGPIMSALVDRYGCRKMTIAGGLISGLGFILASLSNSIEMLLLTFGIIAGIGLGMCYVTMVVSIAFWFDKKRTLAVGLGACGTGIGTFLYAPMTQYFIDVYGWRGTVLLLAGSFLNMCLCGAVMRKPEWLILEQKKQSIAASSCGSDSKLTYTFPGVEEIKSLMKSGEPPEYILSTLTTIAETEKLNNNDLGSFNSVVNLPTFVNQHEDVPCEVLELLSSNTKVYQVILEKYPSLLECQSQTEDKIKVDETAVALIKPKNQICMMRHRNSLIYQGNMMNMSKYHLKASSCPNIYRNSTTQIDDKWHTNALTFVKNMFDFKMFLEFHFFLMSLSMMLLFVWFIVPYFYIAEYMVNNGFTEDDGAFQISIIGITNAIGMVFLGWAGDRPWMNVSKSYFGCMVVCGLSTLTYPFVIKSYYLLSMTSAMFGLSFASVFSFTPTILVELIPLERFTTAYGLILLCQGIGNLLGPPIAGFIYDVTDSWAISFYAAGVFIIISGALVGTISMTKNFRMWGSAPLEKDAERISQLSQISSINA